jgi:6-phosphofructokinase 1
MHTRIKNLGACEHKSPLHIASSSDITFRNDNERVLVEHRISLTDAPIDPKAETTESFEVAGPRRKIFFDPSRTTAGIVTCGGLCPGINDIIKGIVTQLWTRYCVTKIFGFRYGYQGLVQRLGHRPITFRPESVKQIHLLGGSILGNSRGNQPVGEMVDTLEEMGVDILFVVGGDGSLKGAQAIADEIECRGLKKAVVGIPKTIDNDIRFLDKSFGFETAFAPHMRRHLARQTASASCGSWAASRASFRAMPRSRMATWISCSFPRSVFNSKANADCSRQSATRSRRKKAR